MNLRIIVDNQRRGRASLFVLTGPVLSVGCAITPLRRYERAFAIIVQYKDDREFFTLFLFPRQQSTLNFGGTSQIYCDAMGSPFQTTLSTTFVILTIFCDSYAVTEFDKIRQLNGAYSCVRLWCTTARLGIQLSSQRRFQSSMLLFQNFFNTLLIICC